jgi:uncharacterized Zn ribbon protein
MPCHECQVCRFCQKCRSEMMAEQYEAVVCEECRNPCCKDMTEVRKPGEKEGRG